MRGDASGPRCSVDKGVQPRGERQSADAAAWQRVGGDNNAEHVEARGGGDNDRALRAAEAQLGRKLTPPRCLSGGAESLARRVGELAAAVAASGERLRRRESMVCGVWCVEYGVWSMVCAEDESL